MGVFLDLRPPPPPNQFCRFFLSINCLSDLLSYKEKILT